MKPLPVALLATVALAFAHAAPAMQPASPYAGQEARDIKSLSAEDIDGYLAGKGMGLAKAAELNGYAGPLHVLELATQLELSAEQRQRTQALFEAMQSKARALGQALIAEERELDRLFATRAVTPERLASALGAIGALQATIRGAHLEAHIAQAAVLTPEQNLRYAQLRGYARDDSAHKHHGAGNPALPGTGAGARGDDGHATPAPAHGHQGAGGDQRPGGGEQNPADEHRH